MLISYGESKSNYELMRDYGFVVHGNPADRIHFVYECRELLKAGAQLRAPVSLDASGQGVTSMPNARHFKAHILSFGAAGSRCPCWGGSCSQGYPRHTHVFS
jgi:hypothetical protein